MANVQARQVLGDKRHDELCFRADIVTNNFEHPNLARQSVLDPGMEVHVRLGLLRLAGVIIPAQVGLDLASDERRIAADGDEAVDEPVEILGAREPLLAPDEAKDGHALPEPAPPAGEHGRLHGLVHRQQGEHVLEERVRKVADAVVLAAALRRRRLGLLHSVEQVACATVVGGSASAGAGRGKD